jgi:hypothetical protein
MMMPLRPGQTVIIVTSDEPMGDEGNIHQHYIDALSEKFPVIVIAPPGSWKFSTVFQNRKINHNYPIIEFPYKNYMPLKPFPGPATRINDYLNSRKLKELIPAGKQVIFWKFDPMRMVNTQPIKSVASIYHVSDPFFKRFTDRLLAKSADLVVTVNKLFIAHYRALNEQVIFIPHGIGAKDTRVNEEAAPKKWGKFFLMAGSVNDDLDFELLGKIARRFPDRYLLLVGKEALKDNGKRSDFDRLLKLENVHYHGAVHYQALKNFIAASAVCLVTYDTKGDHFFRNPIKITNYAAQLKPIVNTVDIEELKPLADKILFTATDHENFLDKLQQVVDQRLVVDTTFVKTYIADHEYSKLVEKILAALEESLQPVTA